LKFHPEYGTTCICSFNVNSVFSAQNIICIIVRSVFVNYLHCHASCNDSYKNSETECS